MSAQKKCVYCKLRPATVDGLWCAICDSLMGMLGL